MEKSKKSKAQKVASRKKREIDLLSLLKAVWKKRILVILITIAVGATTFVGAKLFITPTYRSSFTAYINNNKEVKINGLTNSDVMAAQALARTYSEIITSRTVLEDSAKPLGISTSGLKSKVSTSISSETEILTVSVVTSDPDTSYRLAKAISKTAPVEVAKIVDGSSMSIIDDPVYPEHRYKPDYLKLTILGTIAGFALTVLIICIKQFFNDKIQSEEDLTDHYNIPIVGVIPDMLSVSKSKGDYYYYKTPDEQSSQKTIEAK